MKKQNRSDFGEDFSEVRKRQHRTLKWMCVQYVWSIARTPVTVEKETESLKTDSTEVVVRRADTSLRHHKNQVHFHTQFWRSNNVKSKLTWVFCHWFSLEILFSIFMYCFCFVFFSPCCGFELNPFHSSLRILSFFLNPYYSLWKLTPKISPFMFCFSLFFSPVAMNFLLKA